MAHREAPSRGGSARTAQWLDQAQQQAWRSYLVGTTLLMDRLDRDLRDRHGISLPEYEILVRLSESAGKRMRMAVLADALSHSRSRVTHTIARMEKLGLVERNTCVDDGRGVEAVLTKKGRQTLVSAAPTHVGGVREALVDVASGDDFLAVGRVFDAVADKLTTPVNAPVSDIRH